MERARQAGNIETDSYDRELFSELESESEGLGVLIQRGSSLLPGFRTLMLDLFAAFFKHNVVFLPETDEPQPCLLEALPYRKDDLTSSYAESYRTLRDEHSYAVCRLDLRGTGSSAGGGWSFGHAAANVAVITPVGAVLFSSAAALLA